MAGAANGRTFVFGAMRYWQRNAGPSPRLAARNQTTPMIFLLLRITAGGQVQLSTLSLPETLTPQQGPSAALSPDGTRLAVAYPAGRVRSCRSSRSAPARSAPGSSRGPRGARYSRGGGLARERGAP